MMALASAQILDASSSKFPWCYGDKKNQKTTAACMAELQYSPLQHGYRSWIASYIVWYSSSWNLAGTQGVYPLVVTIFTMLLSVHCGFPCFPSFSTADHHSKHDVSSVSTLPRCDVVLPNAFHHMCEDHPTSSNQVFRTTTIFCPQLRHGPIFWFLGFTI